MFRKIEINLPQTINITIWKKKSDKYKNILNIYLYNNSKYLKFFYVNKNRLKFDFESNSIQIDHFNPDKNLNKKNNQISNFFKDFFKMWDIYFFCKIKFKGKGFRIRFLKKTKLVKFFFGRSHKTFVNFKNIYMKKINKYKFILKSINKKKLVDNSKIAVNIKPMNLFTLRGLRNSKQIVFKRKGKKGTYI